jgi:hypothetical protein
MTSPFVPSEMSPKERAQHGAALAKGAAFDAVHALYRLRKDQGWTNARIANNVGVDEGWLSKQFAGPRNATMGSVGTLVEGMEGILEIKAYPAEELQSDRTNHDAYLEYEDPVERIESSQQVPPMEKGGVSGLQNDPSVNNIFHLIRQNEVVAPPPVPVV